MSAPTQRIHVDIHPTAKEDDAIVLENVPVFTQQGFRALSDRVRRDPELGIIFQPTTTSLDRGVVGEVVQAALPLATA